LFEGTRNPLNLTLIRRYAPLRPALLSPLDIIYKSEYRKSRNRGYNEYPAGARIGGSVMRVQLDLDQPGVGLLEELKEKTGGKTYKEVFNNAITLLDWAVRQRQEGRVVASLDETNMNYKELQMPALEVAARQATVAAR
jgi:hypothetical protein